MKFLSPLLIILVILGCPLTAEENRCLYFHLNGNYNVIYESEDNPVDRNEAVVDSMMMDDKKYYALAPSEGWNVFWMRVNGDSVFLYEPADSTEFILFNFGAREGESWTLPLHAVMPWTQCFWGETITLAARGDSVVNPKRTFYNCFRFHHVNMNCYDGGLIDTYFARDFGKVAYADDNESGVQDWALKLTQVDTIGIRGLYTMAGNPCLTDPCLPGMAAVIMHDETPYFATIKDVFCRESLSWGQYAPNLQDSVYAEGIVTERTDYLGKTYKTLELIDLQPLPVTSLADHSVYDAPAFNLCQNYPNPFNPSTHIQYRIEQTGWVNLTIYDSMGREVGCLVNQVQSPGSYTIRFDAEGLSSGIYWYRINSGGNEQTKKMLLMH